jgi:uncharacterized circularly permuted ATP-grasp superfamily protein
VPIAEKDQLTIRETALWPASEYVAGSSGYDEFTSAPGVIREHWAELAVELSKLGPTEFRRRAETGRRLVQEQGITYNIYGDVKGMERPWQVDPLPVMMSPEEWDSIERALMQRATLINAVLADTYGPQTLLRSAWLPPALVLGQHVFTFLRCGFGAFTGRPMVGGFRSHADPHWRGVRIGQSAGNVTHSSRSLS